MLRILRGRPALSPHSRGEGVGRAQPLIAIFLLSPENGGEERGEEASMSHATYFVPPVVPYFVFFTRKPAHVYGLLIYNCSGYLSFAAGLRSYVYLPLNVGLLFSIKARIPSF